MTNGSARLQHAPASRQAFTSATRRTAGTRRWRPHLRRPQQHPRHRLSQTVPMLHQALQVVSDTVARGGRVCSSAPSARRRDRFGCGALGAVLRQFALARRHADQLEDDLEFIQRLRKLDELLSGEAQGFTKKERLNLDRERDKLSARWAASRTWGPPRPDVRDRHQQGSDRDPGSSSSRHPGRGDHRFNCDPDKIDYPIPAMTTPHARSRSIATWSPRRRSTASRASRARWASTSVAAEAPWNRRSTNSEAAGEEGAEPKQS